MVDENIRVIIAMDRNLQYQLPIERYGVHLVVLVAKGNGIDHVRHLVDQLRYYLAAGNFVLVKEIG